jgi:hypothetical protein
MSRKDYEAIARIINSLALTDAKRESLGQQMADYFEATNPRFDRERFVKACIGRRP